MRIKPRKVKIYESVRRYLLETYKDEPEAFDPALESENTNKELGDVKEIDLREYQVKIKT